MLDSQIQLGLTYYSMGRTPEAIGEWQAVLEKDSGREEARMYLRLVRGAGRVAPRPVTDSVGNADLADDDSNDAIEISGWSKSVLTSGPGGTHT